jgi:hypothetical protein
MKRTALIICLAAILLLAMAVPAFADTSGTVYGVAVLAPYAIVVSGGGVDAGSPLTYEGLLGGIGVEKWGSQTTVHNVGTADAELQIDQNQAPTAGTDVWEFTSGYTTAHSCGWGFVDASNGHNSLVLPTSDAQYYQMSVLANQLDAGQSRAFNSQFFFPRFTSSLEDHFMSATISAVAPEDI